MPFKPSDIFLTVTSFLGVLVPGAVLIFLLYDRLWPVFDDQPWATHWVVIAVAAYVVGQILAALTELLNLSASGAAIIYWPLRKDVRTFEQGLLLPVPECIGRAAKFHAALSSVRLKKPEAAAEIDHLMADYKLLRSLVGVFVIDLLFAWWSDGPSSPRVILDGVLAVLSFLSFARLYNWALLLAFQYRHLLLSDESSASVAPRPSGG